MNEKWIVITLACALAAAVPAVAGAAGDPLDQATADVAKLTSDASAAKSTIAADGSDVAQLGRDAEKGLFTLRADWKLLLRDATAARKGSKSAHGSKGKGSDDGSGG